MAKKVKPKYTKKYFPKTHGKAMDALKWVQLGAATDEARPVLRYIYTGKNGHAATADGYRLFVLPKDESKNMPEWLIWDTVSQIKKIYIGFKKVRPMSPTIARLNRIGVRTRRFSYYKRRKFKSYKRVGNKHPYRYKTGKKQLKLFEAEDSPGRYPDVWSIVETHNKAHCVEFTVPVLLFEHALNQVKIFARDSAYSCSMYLYPHIADSPPQLIVRGMSAERGEIIVHVKDTKVVKDNRVHGNYDVSLNVTYLLDALKGYDWKDTITVSVAENPYTDSDGWTTVSGTNKVTGPNGRMAIIMSMSGALDRINNDHDNEQRDEIWNTPDVLNFYKHVCEFAARIESQPYDADQAETFVAWIKSKMEKAQTIRRKNPIHGILMEDAMRRIGAAHRSWSDFEKYEERFIDIPNLYRY